GRDGAAAGGKAGEPVGQGVARGQEDHRGADAVGPKRLDDVPAVGVREPDVDDERVRLVLARHRPQELGRAAGGGDLEPLLAKPPGQQGPELRVVLKHHHVAAHHRSPSIAPSGIRCTRYVPAGCALRRRRTASAARRSTSFATKASATTPTTTSSTAVAACIPTPKPRTAPVLAVPASATTSAACWVPALP